MNQQPSGPSREASRRFRLSSEQGLDFPTLRSGRILNRMGRVRGVDCELFTGALQCGLIHGAPKLREIRLAVLASDREAVAEPPVFRQGKARVSVKFDARAALDEAEDDIRWRIYRAGLSGLRAIADGISAGRSVCDALAAIHAATPTENFPAFPDASQQDSELYYAYETFSRATAARRLTIVLSASGHDCPDHDFQPVFEALSEAFAEHGLGTWVGDSQDEIEFSCRDVAAARAFVEHHLPRLFDGSFDLIADKD